MEQVRAPVFGTVALDGGLKAPAGDHELTLPEGGDPEHVVALHQEHVVRIVLAARVQLLAKPLRPGEIALGQAGDRQRAEERRRRARCRASRRARARAGARRQDEARRTLPTMPSTAGSAARMAISRARARRVSGNRRSRSSARSSRRTASALACSCCAASAARAIPGQSPARAAPARSQCAAI